MKSFREYLSEAEAWADSPRTGDGFAINIREETLIETVVHSTREDAVILEADAGMIQILEGYHMLSESVSVEEVELRDGSVVDVKVEYDLDADSYDIESAVDSTGRDVTGALTRQGRLRILAAIGDHLAAEREQSRGDGSEFASFRDLERRLGEGVMSEIDIDLQQIARDPDGDLLYDALTGKMGRDTERYLVNMYNDVSIDNGLHPDDAQEEILDIMWDRIVADYGNDLDEAEYQGRNVPLGKPMQGDVKKFKVYVKDPKTGNVKKVNFGDKTMRIKKSNPKRRKSFRARHNCANPGPRTKARYWSCRKW